ncbi:MAG: leucine-rich repeat domain-containing protein [Chlorobi bacterium]|nr:leucine-rich repeat domain-containing protein [Chlorobiota bacterium]
MQLRALIAILGLFLFGFDAWGQTENNLAKEEIDAYSQQCGQMINYLEGTLNFLGDSTEAASEKDIIINESYAKIFVGENVQIEDDLDENRDIALSKDVQAYLKDIGFFYKNIRFKFEVNSIENFVNDKGQIYFKLVVNRNLQGVTINDDTINNNQLRYVEINLNAIEKDLKIASIYTTLPNKKHEMAFWWNNMAESWKDYFGKGILIYDTLPFSNIISFTDSSLVKLRWKEQTRLDSLYISNGDTLNYLASSKKPAAYDEVFLKYDTSYAQIPDTLILDTKTIFHNIEKMWKTKKIDIANSILIGDLKPLAELTELESVDISNTLIDDLSPLRNLNKLKVLKAGGTPLTNIDALRYSSSLLEIDFSNTPISNIEVLLNLKQLEKLNVSFTNINNFSTLTQLTNLKSLNISGLDISGDIGGFDKLSKLGEFVMTSTNIKDLDFISNNKSIQRLNIDSTNVSDLSPLAGLENLSILQANNTAVKDILVLVNLENLKLIYCDNSKVDKNEASKFIDAKPGTTVIFNTGELLKWWDGLPESWQGIAHSRMRLSDPVNKEQLHKIISIKSVDLANNKAIKSLEPLRMLYRLEELDVSGCDISDLSPLGGLNNLKNININKTKVQSVKALKPLGRLEVLRCENTGIADLSPLENCFKLTRVYADNSNIDTKTALRLKRALPSCLIVYQTEQLEMWWENLSAGWHRTLLENAEAENPPSREQLQEIVDLAKLHIDNTTDIGSLEALGLFNRLEEIQISNTSISDISPLSFLPSLKRISMPNNPVYDISPLSRMETLEELNIENTSVDDLEPLSGLKNLKLLNIAGTKVKSLKQIQGLEKLEILILNNTGVKSLKYLENIRLKELKCYNTRIKASKIEAFKAGHPYCEVVYY